MGDSKGGYKMRNLSKALIILSITTTMASALTVDTNATQQLDNNLAWVDKQIELILPSRVGIKESIVNSLKDPVVLKKPASSGVAISSLLPPPGLTNKPLAPQVVIEPLKLHAIMNKSVLISGKWYQIGQSVRNYTLAEIKTNSVLLVGNKDQKLVLFLTKDNNKIQITTK